MRLAILILILLLLPSIVYAQTIYVDDDNTQGPWDGTIEHPFMDVQDGVDTASENDEVFVFSGTYGPTLVDKNILLTGEDADTTIIDAGGSETADALKISGDFVIVQGLTMTNAGSGEYAAGVDIRGIRNTVKDCIIRNNANHAFYLEDGDRQLIKNNQIIENAGSGIFFGSGSYHNMIVGNVFRTNQIGIKQHSAHPKTVIGNLFEYNTYGIVGWNIMEMHLIANTFQHNYVGLDFSGYCEGWESRAFLNNFRDNTVHIDDNCQGNQYYTDYPMGGNYWDTYYGEDNFSGPDQDEPGSDGIGDEPYTISGKTDEYPLMEPFEGGAPGTVYVDEDYNSSMWGFGYDKFVSLDHVEWDVPYETEVVLMPGIYVSLVMDKRFHLRGYDPDEVILTAYGQYYYDSLTLYSYRSKISDLTILNSGPENGAAGIHIVGDYNEIFNNKIIENDRYGLFLDEEAEFTVVHDNYFEDNYLKPIGIDFFNDDTLFYHNVFMGPNMPHGGLPGTRWDIGYPGGGNYWWNYQGADNYSGPGQNETGPDGIGDTEKSVDSRDDRYPFMIPYGWNLGIARLELTHDEMPGMLTLAGGSTPNYKYLKIEVNDAGGNPIEGISADSFHFYSEPMEGTEYYGTWGLNFIPQSDTTGEDGVLLYELRTMTSIKGQARIWGTYSGQHISDELTLDIRTPDLNIDAEVNLPDFIQFGQEFGTNATDSDLDFDGDVDLADFIVFGSYWPGEKDRIKGEFCISADCIRCNPDLVCKLQHGKSAISDAVPSSAHLR